MLNISLFFFPEGRFFHKGARLPTTGHGSDMLSIQMTPSGRRGSSTWSAKGASPQSLQHGDDGRMSVPDHSAEWRRALKMLADLPEDSTEALLLAHGFTSAVIAGLLDTGLATSTLCPSWPGAAGSR